MRDSILGRSLQLQKESGHQISNRHTSASTNLNSSSSSPKKSKKSSQRSKDHSSSSSKMTTAGASYESSKHQSGAAAVDHLSATAANQLVLPVQPHSWVAPDGNNSNIDNSVGSSENYNNIDLHTDSSRSSPLPHQVLSPVELERSRDSSSNAASRNSGKNSNGTTSNMLNTSTALHSNSTAATTASSTTTTGAAQNHSSQHAPTLMEDVVDDEPRLRSTNRTMSGGSVKHSFLSNSIAQRPSAHNSMSPEVGSAAGRPSGILKSTPGRVSVQTNARSTPTVLWRDEECSSRDLDSVQEVDSWKDINKRLFEGAPAGSGGCCAIM
ncbi:unnamed protein product [Amoebophrya sp. A120]|nr:unnamed protein product [Amoebophrya sp. A120]|eukprot:GSA120T00022074001.1